MEGMPVADLAKRKKDLVQELNGYIAQKKALSEAAESHAALIGGAKGKSQPKGQDGKLLAKALCCCINQLFCCVHAPPLPA